MCTQRRSDERIADEINWRDNKARYRTTEWHHYRFNMASHRDRRCITQRCASRARPYEVDRAASGISRQIAFRDIERVLFD